MMYEVYDNLLTIDEQNIITNILFDSNFPYYFINSPEQKSVSNLTYDKLSQTMPNYKIWASYLDNFTRKNF